MAEMAQAGTAAAARIVVADDEAGIRELVRLCLSGHVILEAATGDEALDLIRRERPNLAILDLAMPGLSGLEVAKALAEDPAGAAIPVVICTASSAEVLPVAGRCPTVCAVISKPFKVGALRQAVDQALAMGRDPGARSGRSAGGAAAGDAAGRPEDTGKLVARQTELVRLRATLGRLHEEVISLRQAVDRQMWAPPEAQQADDLSRRRDRLHGEMRRLQAEFQSLGLGEVPSFDSPPDRD